jgi:cytochrome o ubiquinol oxidase subunit 2
MNATLQAGQRYPLQLCTFQRRACVPDDGFIQELTTEMKAINGNPSATATDRRKARLGGWPVKGSIVCLAAFALAGCQPALLNPKGQIGIADETILIDSIAIMLAIVVPTLLATLGFAWWFRASNSRAEYTPDWTYSGRIELMVWSIPLLTIMLLGGVAWIGSHELDPARKLNSTMPALEVQGVSLDWKWLFIYPQQQMASVNSLEIPIGTPIHFTLTSASVMNAFFIPQLGSMIYTMNGMTTQLNLDAAVQGTYRGQSSHFSGDGFSDMHFDVKAVSAAEFTAWVQAAKAAGPALDAGSYENLARQSKNVQPFTYKTVDAGLFNDIATQKLPPGPGPQTGAPNPGVSARTGQ